ncbi:hypothetical protein [Sphingomonas sp. KR3-1]|uniref:DUF6916 family protein n=1 Tax=Sphingomonas sp. KR3-1 TaxID=3156611 RepID=UPI0032B51ABD
MTQGAGPALPPEEPAQLGLGDFEPHIGTRFAVDTSAGAQPLILTSATAIPNSPRPAGGFQLEFSGPAQPTLSQGIYAFAAEGIAHEIFISPVGRAADGAVQYHAVFF